MVVEGCRNDWWAREGNEPLEGRIGMQKTLTSGWRAGEGFMMEWA